MNNLSRIGAQGFSHSGTQLGNVKLVSRVAMVLVTGCLLLFAEGCSTPDRTPSKAEEADRRAKLRILVMDQMILGREAARKGKWGEAAQAVAKVLQIDPDHAGAQELERRVFWGALPEKTSGNLKYKSHPTEPVCSISGVIEKYAETVVLPTQIEGRSVVRIEHSTFKHCWSLKSVTIPSSVTSIGDNAFSDCEKLADISVAEGNPSYQADDGVLFTKGGKTLLRYPEGKPGGSYTIPPSVARIGERAFLGCSNLKSMTIPSSVTRIGRRAFYFCHRLTSVTIPPSVTRIEGATFIGCRSLASVTIPSSVTRIGTGAFMGCEGLKSVTIPSSVTRIGYGVFEGCLSLKSVTIPTSVTRIGEGAFSGCENLVNLSVAEGNPSYRVDGGVLFTMDGKNLVQYPGGKTGESYTIPSSVTTIEDSAFSGCRGLTSVTIPSSVRIIEERAFADCTGLKSVMLPKGVKIGSRAFENCPWQPSE